ncbi:aromatic ring-hydroxylating dioxygenase subunit alpha [Aquabacterium sp. J223]|uniref:aromatic ring-hydroxylating dioxygenase subunit alpha n=1 Tax=Aquabacterium sp. J223 TaxID=2898431 RepID=UPI0021ADE0A4|nr:aromatic ring-hydroxylating dioxygenase subunit alpha [Aquabacterium sp. J223]UUX95278.1 aromatic ring-hydroxylating dioxygenase subunit alpha [Aquabacterium sp. J223]
MSQVAAAATQDNFLREGWYVVAQAADVGRAPKPITVCGELVVLYRAEDGQVVALQDRCPHRLVPLSMGRLIGDRIQCAYHGVTFDRTGRCVHIPGDPRGEERLPRQYDVPTYAVREEYGFIWLWPGSGEQAPTAPLPPFTEYLDQPGWTCFRGYQYTKADASLIIDNLLDLSHEATLHPQTIGNAAVGETPAKTTIGERRIEVERLMADCPPPAMFREAAGFTGNIDRYQRVVFTPPSSFCIVVRATPVAGTTGASLAWYVHHLLTPEKDGATHYFFALTRNFSIDEPKVTEVLRQGAHRTLAEDHVILEAQQVSLGSVAFESRRIHTAFDGAPNAGRKMIEALRRLERDNGQRDQMSA